MNAPVVAPEVARFVAEVRAALDDLDAEVVEELTGGLEADLTDSLEASRTAGPGFAGADEASAATVLGDPVGYAAELRSSAGLPPRAPAPAPSPPSGRWPWLRRCTSVRPGWGSGSPGIRAGPRCATSW